MNKKWHLWLASVLAACIFPTMIFADTESALSESSMEVSSIEDIAVSTELLSNSPIFDQKIAELKARYPDGTFWSNDTTYPGGWHGCWAFANMMADNIFGYNTPRNSWSVTNIDNVKPGDIISSDRWVDGGWVYDHTMFVIDVNGDTLTIAEGNYNSHVKWGRQINKYSKSFTVYHAPNYDTIFSQFHLDVNGYIDSQNTSNVSGFGTFDVYINGSRVADDVADYYTVHPVGTRYEIADIKVKNGKAYGGIRSGVRKGTINGETEVRMIFGTITDFGTVSKIQTFNGHTYYFVNRQSSWYASKYISEEMGGHLVTITSAAENDFLNSFAKDQDIWIGLTDETIEGSWKWVNGESFSYKNWTQGEPNNLANDVDWAENYAVKRANGSWNDSYGTDLHPFICEIDKAYTVKYDANGGTGAPSSQAKAFGHAITLSTVVPTRACHTFLGWSTNKSATKADYAPGASYKNDADLTLYAVWAEGVSTEWSTSKPSGVSDSQIETKTQYRYSDRKTITSSEPNLSGYQLVSSKWNKTASGTIDYVANWPGGFDRAHWCFGQYNKTPKSASETQTKRVTVSSSRIGYIYWHWCLGAYEYGPVNRTISDEWTSRYPHFDAFYTTQDASHYDDNGVNGGECFCFINRDVCRDTYWWFRLNVMRQTYTEETKEFTYQKWSDWSSWSDTNYTASDSRKVETRTLYRAKNSGGDPHTWDAGKVVKEATTTSEGQRLYTCQNCGATKTVAIPKLVDTNVPVSGIQLNKTNLSLKVGTSETLVTTVSPSNATNKSVTWSSGNTAIATVNNGKVTAVAPGTVYIYATSSNGLRATCVCSVMPEEIHNHTWDAGKVVKAATTTSEGQMLYTCQTCGATKTVAIPKLVDTNVPVSGIQLNKTNITLEVGASETIVATVSPSNATNKSISWSSGNTAIASVKNGKITAVAPGTVYIYATTSNGLSVTCICFVTAPLESMPLRDYVTSLYENFLRRTPDEAGLTSWVNALSSGRATGAQVVSGFVLSPEYKSSSLSNRNYVTALYRVILSREPDTSGLNTWVSYLENGCTNKKVLAGFVNSTEFGKLCSNLGIRQGSYTSDEIADQNPKVSAFVARLYKVCLGRQYEQEGLNNWVSGLLGKKLTGSSVAKGFFQSTEFINRNLSDRNFVIVAYRTLLNREPDTGGLMSWVSALGHKSSRMDVINGFLKSQEFGKLCADYGIVR